MPSVNLEYLKALTEKLHKEDKKLKEDEELFRKSLDSAYVAMIVVNRDREIVIINRQAEYLFGYDHGELIGQKIDILVPDRFVEAYNVSFSEFIENPRKRFIGNGDLDIYAKRKDGSDFSVEISLNPINLNGNFYITSVIRDLSKYEKQ